MEELFNLYVNKLQQYGVYSPEMIESIGESLKVAPFTLTVKQGGAYDGGLIDVTLNKLCVFGIKLNNVYKETGCAEMVVDNNTLIRVLLIQHIAKAVMFEPVIENWKLNRGELYQFADLGTVFKLGERTLILCKKYGIQLTEEEMEAILICDKEDLCTLHMNPLVNLVKMANQMAVNYLAKKNV